MARMLSTALAAALVGALALAGCKKHDNADTAADTANAPAATTPDAAPPAETAPAAGPMATTTPPATSPILTGLDLGNAVFHGYPRLVEFLVEQGADVNHEDEATGPRLAARFRELVEG